MDVISIRVRSPKNSGGLLQTEDNDVSVKPATHASGVRVSNKKFTP